MITIEGRNVNELWVRGLDMLRRVGVEQDSRAGRVLVAPCPVVSVYESPRERVLMDPSRDANPFFHLMESLWMLAGRDDAAFLNRYVSDFGKRFAEHGDDPDDWYAAYIHGAYGKRWRNSLGHDQLTECVKKLRKNSDDRQCVIQMWDSGQFSSPSGGHDDLCGDWKDRPCNTHVYLRVRRDTRPMETGVDDNERGEDHRSSAVLDLTVLCRSNDIVWGAYGANVVHFSVLQEYLAGRIGVGVGKMYQFSNNWHGYVSVLSKVSAQTQHPGEPWNNPYKVADLTAMPMGTDWDRWDEDLARFMKWHDETLWGDSEWDRVDYANSWFQDVAVPVARANWHWKKDVRSLALGVANMITASDWRASCVAWMQRRMK